MIIRRALSAIAALVLAVAWLVPAAAIPAAADCVTDDEAVLIQHANVIFTGTVVADQAAKFGKEREYTFRVDKVYKGAVFNEQIVASDANSSTALEVKVQQSYLVLASYPAEGTIGPVARLEGNRCQGTRPLTADNPVPSSLGAGQDPAVGSSRSLTSRLSGPIWIVVGVACILFAGVVAIRNRRGNPERT